MESEPLGTIEVSKGKRVTVYWDWLDLNGERISFKDVTGISFWFTNTVSRVFFVPLQTVSEFGFQIVTAAGKRDIKSPQVFKFGGPPGTNKSANRKAIEATFANLVTVFEGLIRPHVLVFLLREFHKEQSLTVGPFKITPEGISKKKVGLFQRGFETLPWSRFESATLAKGALIISQKEDSRKVSIFASCWMGITNAVVLPTLLRVLSKSDGVVDVAKLEELEKVVERGPRKSARSSRPQHDDTPRCSSCGSPIEPDQNFCTNCGHKVSR